MQRRNRRIGKEKPFILGLAAFEKISAVEGMLLPSEMKSDFRRFDQERLQPSARRAVLSAKYGRRSD
jgi:hypothetical protein